MKKLRFKNKTYGWGRVPCAWQGWIIVLIYAIDIVLVTMQLEEYVHTNPESLLTVGGTLAHILISTIFLLIIAWTTGETPEWRRGKKKADK